MVDRDIPRWLPITLFIAALAAAFWRAPMPAPAHFEPTPPASTPPLAAEFFSEKIPEANGNVGPSTLARLPDGRLIIAWQETRTEEASDAKIRLQFQDKQGNWSKARDVASRATVAGHSFAYLSQLDRPLLYAEGNWLHLWFVTHGISDWRSAAIIHTFSSDGGQSWATQSKMAIAPGFNPGGLQLAPPVQLAEGELALPLQENSGKVHSWLRLAATGTAIEKIRLPAEQSLMQQGPAAVNQPPGAESLIALSDKNLLAAGHPEGNRKILQLWHSIDGGQHWQTSRVIERAADGAAEFTHPFLLRTRDGRIHLTYTWRQQGIRHLYFTEAWLAEGDRP